MEGCDLKCILGNNFERAVVYGSYARGDYNTESDIDIAVFTSRKPQEFYLLINEIKTLIANFNKE